MNILYVYIYIHNNTSTVVFYHRPPLCSNFSRRLLVKPIQRIPGGLYVIIYIGISSLEYNYES